MTIEEILNTFSDINYAYNDCTKYDTLKRMLEELTSVTPQQKVGRWITSHIPESVLCECSECGFTCGAYSFNYCPECGTRMEVK